jgi:hypothetical protein
MTLNSRILEFRVIFIINKFFEEKDLCLPQSDFIVIYISTPIIFLPPLKVNYNLREVLFYRYNYGILSSVR